MNTVEKVKIKDRVFLCKLHRGPYNQIGSTFDQVFNHFKSQNLPLREALGLYYDNPSQTEPDQLRSHAGMEVDVDFNRQFDGFELITIPAGFYAKHTCMGSYSNLPAAWEKFMKELDESNLDPDYHYTFEIYVNDCDLVPEEEVQTDIYCSLKG